jgi:putative transposase
VILLCVRWYAAYSLSRSNLEEMMAERGFEVDHSSVHRWVIKLVPLLEKAFREKKRPVGKSWRMDETYVKVHGQWKYLYRAVDKAGNTVDFLLPIVTRLQRAVTLKRPSIATARLRP